MDQAHEDLTACTKRWPLSSQNTPISSNCTCFILREFRCSTTRPCGYIREERLNAEWPLGLGL